jgi:holo-[acyl-carrier protein] synthase
MIYGIGTDLVAVARMTELHARFGTRLAERILAGAELADYAGARDKDRLLAKRFAAKEALAKALGTGLRAPVSLTNIIVEHDDHGRPGFSFAPDLQAWLSARRIATTHLSISDEQGHAVAFVIAES